MDAELSQREKSSGRSSHWDSAIRRIQDAAVLLALIGLPLFHTTRVHNVFLAKSGLALVVGGVLGMAWFSGMAVRRHLRLNSISLYGAILIFVATSGASLILVAGNPARGLEMLLFQVTGFLLFFAVLEGVCSEAKILNLMRTVSWTSLVIASIGLLEESGVYLIPSNVRVPLPVATIGNTNFVAHYLDLTIPVTASLLFIPGERSGWKGVLTAIALAATCCVMVLTQCRGGWVSVGLVALVFAALKLRTVRWVRFVPVLLLSAALVSPMLELLFNAVRSEDASTLSGALGSQMERTWERASSTLDETDLSRSMRIMLWKNTADMIASQPFGVGTGNYEFSLPAFRSMSEQREWKQLEGNLVLGAYNAHNEYLEYLSETGIVGFLAIVALFGGILWRGWRYLAGRREWTGQSIAAAGCLGAVGAALVHALFSFNLQDPVSGTLFWVLAGLLVSLTTDKDRGGITVSLKSKARRIAVAAVGAGIAVVSINCGVRILIADGYYLKGMQRFNEGKGLEAIEAMRQASQWRDADFRHHHMLGVFTSFVAKVAGTDSEIGRGMHAEAESALRRSIELHPNNAQALRLLGRTVLRIDRGGEAIELLRRTVELDPLNEDNYGLLADAYRATGDNPSALEARKQALSFRPHDTVLMMDLATEYRLSGDLESSAAVLERAASLRPHDGIVQGSLGSVYLALGKIVDAERALRIAVGVEPSIVAWRHNLVRSLLRQRHLAQAEEELKNALELFPQDEVLISIAELFRAGDR